MKKYNRIIWLLAMIFGSMLFISSISINDFTFWAYNIRNNKEVVNEKSRTVVVLTRSMSCSGCVKLVSAYFKNVRNNPDVGLVVVTEFYDNVLLRRGRLDEINTTFNTPDKVLFLNFNTDSLGNNTLLNFNKADFPVVAFVDNPKREVDLFVFDKIAKTTKWGLLLRKGFDKKAKQFLKGN